MAYPIVILLGLCPFFLVPLGMFLIVRGRRRAGVGCGIAAVAAYVVLAALTWTPWLN